MLNQPFIQAHIKENIRGTGLYEGNSPVTGKFLPEMASNVENVSILWRHHVHHQIIWVSHEGVCIYDYCHLVQPTFIADTAHCSPLDQNKDMYPIASWNDMATKTVYSLLI